jgi:hypothetical protein
MMMGAWTAFGAPTSTTAVSPSPATTMATFPGHVSRLNDTGGLMRVRSDFKNAKFLNRGDSVEFWGEVNPQARCVARVEARSTLYLLLRVPEYDACVRRVHLTVGAYLHFWSRDLENNLVTARELVEILMKKRMALLAKKRHHERDLEGHGEKVAATNARYELLKRKLEAEHQKSLGDLEDEKAQKFVVFKQFEARLNEVESKLESYRVHDQNYTLDRWALDPALHIKK